MKKLKYIVLLSGLVAATSCKKTELELFPYNQIETSQAFNTEADVTLAVNGMYAGLKESGSYFVNGIWNIIADALADNLIINQAGRLTLKTYGEWRYTGEDTYGLFSGGYTIIRRANAILENIDKFTDGPFKDNAKGEALAVRGLVYFDMSRVYGKTYLNASNTDSLMPYVTSTDPTIKPAKEPVHDFYDKVIADLELAKTLIGSFESNGVYRFNSSAVSGLLSRVYLYKGDWPACIAAANDALGATPNLPSLADFPKIWTDEPGTASSAFGVLFKVRNTATDDHNAQGVNYYQTVSGARKSEYVVEYNFKQLFLPSDIRLSTYIETSDFNGKTYNNVVKYNGRTNGDASGVVDGKVLRTAEALLNRAEAYYRNSNEDLALDDLQLLKSERYAAYDPASDDALAGQALLDEILLQRRLELAFEGDRFWDLKRRNQPVIRDGSKGEIADGSGTPYVFTTLPATDHRFQLPFPVDETNFNTNLKQVPGY